MLAILIFWWTFILAVAFYDGRFAWRHRADFLLWELNPMAKATAGFVGIPVMLVAKAGITLATCGLAFGIWGLTSDPWPACWLTSIAVGIHAWLAGRYWGNR